MLLLLLALPAALAQLALTGGRLAKSDQTLSTFTSETSAIAPVTRLDAGDSLDLSFFVTLDGAPVQPAQTMLLWLPTDASEHARTRDYLGAVKTRKSGKGSYSLVMARAPTALLSLSVTGHVSATLLVAVAGDVAPLRIALGDFVLAPSLTLPFPFPPNEDLPRAWEVERYAEMPPLAWTFAAAEKRIGVIKAAGGSIAVLAPWVVLLSIVGHLKPSLSSPTLNILAFLLCIVAFESLVVAYWTSLKLIPTLPYFGSLGLMTAYTGRKALGDMRVRRLARDAAAKKSL